MADTFQSPVRGTATDYDAGLRAYMVRVYNYLTLGIGISALSAFAIHRVATTAVPVAGAEPYARGLWLTPAGHALYGWPGMIGFLVVGIGLILAMAAARGRAAYEASLGIYAAFTAVCGLVLAAATARHSAAAAMHAAVITAAVFGSMSLYGYTTRRSLSGLGSFLFMGLSALVIAGFANVLLFHSSGMQLVLSVVGVLVFVGYVAYDTQQIKEAYSERMDRAELGCVALWGAMDLFLDVLNLFLDLLRLVDGDTVSSVLGSLGGDD